MKNAILFAVALALVACGGGEPSVEERAAKCSGVCEKIQGEELAKCGSDALCKDDANSKYAACKGLCASIAKGPAKPMAEQVQEVEGKCDKGDHDACAELGGAYLLGKGGKAKDEPKGAEMLKKSCDAGSALGCELWGRALDLGKGVTKDHAAALVAWDKACSKDNGGACRSLALDLGTTDPKRIPLLDKACTKDDAIGCMGLGAAYLHGNQGAPKDLAKAKQALQKSCDLGQKSACAKAKEI